MTQTEKAPINVWKIAFILLAGLVIGSGIFLGTRIFSLREPSYETPTITERQGEPVLTINTQKEKVNQLIDFYLSDFQKDSDIKYSFYLENQALLNGEFKVLGMPVNFYLYFEPYVMENGNVQLKAKSLSIGTLGLPIKDVMNMVKKNYKLPDWVEVDAKEQTVLIRLDQFRMQNGMYLKADRINLVDDSISFSLYLPDDSQKESAE
ncbi:hypothetical protein BAU15_09475 [Enterococcus sp. JM4C]|uniref:YpmS family protein n=1 Tax=Candidatus Enterococcus huntleyi TaxID=1857217 RepID=UPI001379E2D9|nr:YpmS family protein [Enterococcus sp. JM4C]KAF1298167.1 hypothetical protein BAU15_09475 [Enterococcus sp. JM4C]